MRTVLCRMRPAPGGLGRGDYLSASSRLMTSGRRRLIVVLVALGLVVAAVSLLAWRAEAWLRGEIERRLQERLVPAVSLAGPLSFSVWPRPQLVLRDLALRDDGGVQLLAIERLALEIGVGALSADSFSIAALQIGGASARLVRGGDRQWNVASWLRASPSGGGVALPLRLGQLVVSDGDLRVEDATSGLRAELSALHLEVGPLALGETATASLSARVALAEPLAATGRLRLAGSGTAVPVGLVLQGLEMNLAGTSGDWVLESAEFRVDRLTWTPEDGARGEGGRGALRLGGPIGRARASLELAAAGGAGTGWWGEGLALTLSAEDGRSALTGRLMAPDLALQDTGWSVPAGQLSISAALSEGRQLGGRLPFDAKGVGAAGQISFGPARVVMPHPAGGARELELQADGRLSIAAGLLGGEISGAFDRSHFAGSWRYRSAAAIPLELALIVDRLDADRYLPSEAAKAQPPALGAWGEWPVRAEASIGILRYRGFDAKNVRLSLNGGTEEASARPHME